MENAQKALANCLPEDKKHHHLTPEIIRECYNAGPSHIQTALQPYGYFHTQVQSTGLTRSGQQWSAHYTITPGHRLHITQITLRLEGPGKEDPALLTQLATFPLKQGDVFNAIDYENARDLLLQVANQNGWLEAAFSQKEVRINLTDNTAALLLTLQTGHQFYFGAVDFSPNPFNPAFLQRFVLFHPDEPFSSEKLLKLQENLGSSGYFQEVIVTPNTEKAVHYKVPVHIQLTPPRGKRYLMGVGYGTFTGPRATLGVDYRRVGDSGQHFTLQARVSSVLKGLSAKYFIPGKNPLTDQYILGAEVQKFVPDNGHSLSENLSISRVMTFEEWQHTLSLHFLNERYQVDDTPSESSRLFYPDYALGWVSADNMLNPRSAKSVHLGIRGASANILSFTNFIQGDIKAKQIFSPTEASRIILRGGFGYTVVNDLSRLPLTLRYFAGGMDSVRGYPYSSIGPGRYLETAGVEVQHRLIGDLSGAIFYDLGTATDHLNDNLMKGAGIGVIYHSVIGSVRLYVARALSKPGDPFRIEFSLGPDF